MSPRARKQTQTLTSAPPSGSVTMAAPSTLLPGPARLDRITRRAYEIYERRGGQDGHSMDDWLQAEREVDDEA